MSGYVPKQTEQVAFVRLHALVRKGYRADLGVQSDTDFIRLEHPRGTAAGAPGLVLHPDGLIHGIDNTLPLNTREGDPDCIYANHEADWEIFHSFVKGLPEPTMLQALSTMTIWDVKMVITIYLIVGGLAVALVLFGGWVYGLATRQ